MVNGGKVNTSVGICSRRHPIKPTILNGILPLILAANRSVIKIYSKQGGRLILSIQQNSYDSANQTVFFQVEKRWQNHVICMQARLSKKMKMATSYLLVQETISRTII
jgi:hypothetical protein